MEFKFNLRHFFGTNSIVHFSAGAIEEALSWIGKRPVIVAHVLVASMHNIPSCGSQGTVAGHLQIVVRLQAQLGNGQDNAMADKGGKDELEDHLEFTKGWT